jgi:hypothetical protein
MGAGSKMATQIAGKITVEMGVTTVDLHVGAQTVRLTIGDTRELAQELSDTATRLQAMITAAHKPKH